MKTPPIVVAAESREAGGVAAPDAAQEIADRHGATVAQVLAWTLSRGPHVLAIPGTSSPDHLEENLRAGTLALSPDYLTTLTSITD
ncbi:aldo/keto reductase [Kribbella sp. NPDC048915]|uniref:aldo/keto reductase n=1 Tax=Kribbella sp. NPDC048915 TaxID=3155148 RepID=UPI0033D67271